jgi:hypothetical protein
VQIVAVGVNFVDILYVSHPPTLCQLRFSLTYVASKLSRAGGVGAMSIVLKFDFFFDSVNIEKTRVVWVHMLLFHEHQKVIQLL